MHFHKEYLDLVLVPSGLIIMFGYHLFLLYWYLSQPHKTVYGFENNDKKAWVDIVMKMNDRGIALTVLGSNISGATFLASVSLTLGSIVGAWLANTSIFESQFIYGDTRPSTMSIKYISLIICFLLAFSSFVQSTRSFIHATYLISIPDSNIPTKYVELLVIRGGAFWALGLRALYFATNFLLWFFGPIPMFAASLVMVFLLYYIDTNTTPLHNHFVEGKQTVRLTSGSRISI